MNISPGEHGDISQADTAVHPASPAVSSSDCDVRRGARGNIASWLVFGRGGHSLAPPLLTAERMGSSAAPGPGLRQQRHRHNIQETRDTASR